MGDLSVPVSQHSSFGHIQVKLPNSKKTVQGPACTALVPDGLWDHGEELSPEGPVLATSYLLHGMMDSTASMAILIVRTKDKSRILTLAGLRYFWKNDI